MLFKELNTSIVFKYDGIFLQKMNANTALNIHYPYNTSRKLYYISPLAELGVDALTLDLND